MKLSVVVSENLAGIGTLPESCVYRPSLSN